MKIFEHTNDRILMIKSLHSGRYVSFKYVFPQQQALPLSSTASCKGTQQPVESLQSVSSDRPIYIYMWDHPLPPNTSNKASYSKTCPKAVEDSQIHCATFGYESESNKLCIETDALLLRWCSKWSQSWWQLVSLGPKALKLRHLQCLAIGSQHPTGSP